jgi:hypothetical protein
MIGTLDLTPNHLIIAPVMLPLRSKPVLTPCLQLMFILK